MRARLATMLTLYYAPDNASLILRLALEELREPYETVLVDRSANAQKSRDYLKLNPIGVIPTLITPHGPISETAACLLWLADRNSDSAMAPAPHDPKRGAFLRWLFFLSNTVHADLLRLFYPHRVVPSDATDAHHAMLSKRIMAHLEILEAAAKTETALFAPPSALILYLGPLVRWSALYPLNGERWFELGAYPALKALMLSLEERPSVHVAIHAEGLGETPFSAPKLPDPPEGSAL